MRQMLVMSAIAFGMIAAVTFQAVNYGVGQLLGIGNTPESTVFTIAETQENDAAGFRCKANRFETSDVGLQENIPYNL